jgi:hypothetical protein
MFLGREEHPKPSSTTTPTTTAKRASRKSTTIADKTPSTSTTTSTVRKSTRSSRTSSTKPKGSIDIENGEDDDDDDDDDGDDDDDDSSAESDEELLMENVDGSTFDRTAILAQDCIQIPPDTSSPNIHRLHSYITVAFPEVVYPSRFIAHSIFGCVGDSILPPAQRLLYLALWNATQNKPRKNYLNLTNLPEEAFHSLITRGLTLFSSLYSIVFTADSFKSLQDTLLSQNSHAFCVVCNRFITSSTAAKHAASHRLYFQAHPNGRAVSSFRCHACLFATLRKTGFKRHFTSPYCSYGFLAKQAIQLGGFKKLDQKLLSTLYIENNHHNVDLTSTPSIDKLEFVDGCGILADELKKVPNWALFSLKALAKQLNTQLGLAKKNPRLSSTNNTTDTKDGDILTDSKNVDDIDQ